MNFRTEGRVRDNALEHTPEERASELRNTLWWMKARRLLIRRFVRLAAEAGPLSLIMDIGCGDGDDIDLLAEFGTVVGVERSARLAARARERGTAERVLEGDWPDLDAPPRVSLFTAFDALEHCENDREFVEGFRRFGTDGHLVLLKVPACQFLYGEHDRLLHHYRRYSKRSLHGLLERCGYQIIRSEYAFFLLFPFAVLSRLKEKLLRLFGRRQVAVNLGEVPSWLNRVLFQAARLEIPMLDTFSFPVGLWLFVLARHVPGREVPGAKPAAAGGRGAPE